MGIYTFYSLSFEPRTKRCMTGKSQFLHRHDWMVKITWVPPWQRSRTDRIKEITSYWWRSDLWGFLKPHRFVVVVSLGLRASPVFTHPTGGLFKVLDNIFYIQTEWISWREDGCSFLGGLTIIDSWWSAFDQLELQRIFQIQRNLAKSRKFNRRVFGKLGNLIKRL